MDNNGITEQGITSLESERANILSSSEKLIDEYLEQEARKLADNYNRYSEQPQDLIIGACKKEILEQYRLVPSIKDFPPLAQNTATEDLSTLLSRIEETSQIMNLKSTAERIATFFKIYPCIYRPYFADSNNAYGIRRQDAFQPEVYLHDGPFIKVSANQPWVTKEECILTKVLKQRMHGVAKTIIASDSNGYINQEEKIIGSNHIKEIKKLRMYAENDQIRVPSNDEYLKVAEYISEPQPIFHGTTIKNFLEILESGALLCRKRQIEEKRSANFSTSENKQEGQEMENISFSDYPNRGYTREGKDYWHLGPPQNVWLITDLSYLIKDGEEMCFSYDGWQFFGKSAKEGFSLNIKEPPVCFMIPETTLNKITNLIRLSSKFSDKDSLIGWLMNKTLILPDQYIDSRLEYKEAAEFTLDEKILGDIKKLLNPDNSFRHEKGAGFFVPSGELGEDKYGEKIMTYSWKQI